MGRATLGCIFLNFCLTGLASLCITRWCTIRDGSNPGISSYEQEKTSINSVRRQTKITYSSRLRVAPSLMIWGFFSIPILTSIVFSTSDLEPSCNYDGVGGRLISSSISASERISPIKLYLFSWLWFFWFNNTSKGFSLGDFNFLFFCFYWLLDLFWLRNSSCSPKYVVVSSWF